MTVDSWRGSCRIVLHLACLTGLLQHTGCVPDLNYNPPIDARHLNAKLREVCKDMRPPLIC